MVDSDKQKAIIQNNLILYKENNYGNREKDDQNFQVMDLQIVFEFKAQRDEKLSLKARLMVLDSESQPG